MLKPTHRAFNFAAANGVLFGAVLLHPEWVDTTDLLGTVGRISLIQAGAVLSASWPDHLEIVHRGFSHSLWVVLLLGAGTLCLSPYPLLFALAIGITLGWFFHLFGDAFSTAGVAWFYPIQNYRRYEGGAFCVKGWRGPFLPFYKVGDPAFSFMRVLWWILGVVLMVGIYDRIGGLL